MTTLVTGGTGKTGRLVVDRLAAGTTPVRVASRTPATGLPDGATAVRFDWDDPSTHDASLDGVDTAYLVAPALVLDPSPVMLPFVERARAAGVQRMVLLSANGAEQAPPDFGLNAVQGALAGSGAEWAVLRPTWFLQNLTEGFLAPGIAHGVLAFPGGTGRNAWIDTRDIADVAVAALHGKADGDLLLTGPELLSFADLAAEVSRASGIEVRYVDQPPEELAAVLQRAGFPDDYAGLMLQLAGAIRDGHAEQLVTTVQDVTGRPGRTLRQFADDNADAWRASAG